MTSPRDRLADPLRRLEQDMQAGVWRGCRPAFVRDGRIEGFPSFSMADLREISEAVPALLSERRVGREEIARAVEPVIIRRIYRNRIEGYTIETSEELADVILSLLNGEDHG